MADRKPAELHHDEKHIEEASHVVDDTIDLVRDFRKLARTVMLRFSPDEKRTEEDAKKIRDSVIYDINPLKGHIEFGFIIDKDPGMIAESFKFGDHTEVVKLNERKSPFSDYVKGFLKVNDAHMASHTAQESIAIELLPEDVTAMGVDTKYLLSKHPHLFRHYQQIHARLTLKGDLKYLGEYLHTLWRKQNKIEAPYTYWIASVVLEQQGKAVENPFYVKDRDLKHGAVPSTTGDEVEVLFVLSEKAIGRRIAKLWAPEEQPETKRD